MSIQRDNKATNQKGPFWTTTSHLDVKILMNYDSHQLQMNEEEQISKSSAVRSAIGVSNRNFTFAVDFEK